VPMPRLRSRYGFTPSLLTGRRWRRHQGLVDQPLLAVCPFSDESSIGWSITSWRNHPIVWANRLHCCS
jgi:hypothetical protein